MHYLTANPAILALLTTAVLAACAPAARAPMAERALIEQEEPRLGFRGFTPPLF